MNRITRLFGIDYPLIQAGMVWTSGWKLASAVSMAGGLGVIGSGSMTPEVLRAHIKKCKSATPKPFGVNVPLLYKDIDRTMDVILSEQVPIVFTSAGNPALWTSVLKERGVIVVHVVPSAAFAVKAEKAGCHAIVAEGFEAGGHNGREETTTLCLVPQVCGAVSVPVIAAGGILSGRSMLAAMVLGAEGVQMGSRFVASDEASVHDGFKAAVLAAKEGDTALTLKQVMPVRVLKNAFYALVKEAEQRGATPDELKLILGKGRARKGMFEGDLDAGELEIGQVSAMLTEILPAGEIVRRVWGEFQEGLYNPIKNT